jgi:hypothetical protein
MLVTEIWLYGAPTSVIFFRCGVCIHICMHPQPGSCWKWTYIFRCRVRTSQYCGHHSTQFTSVQKVHHDHRNGFYLYALRYLLQNHMQICPDYRNSVVNTPATLSQYGHKSQPQYFRAQNVRVFLYVWWTIWRIPSYDVLFKYHHHWSQTVAKW